MGVRNTHSIPKRKLIYSDTNNTVGSNTSMCNGLPTATRKTAALDLPPSMCSALWPAFLAFASRSVIWYVSGSQSQFSPRTADTMNGIQKLHLQGSELWR